MTAVLLYVGSVNFSSKIEIIYKIKMTWTSKNDFELCDEDDPNRCEGVSGRKGQCRNKAIKGSKYCPAHIGRGLVTLKRQQMYNYNLTKFRAQVQSFATNPAIKSLREEIGVLRMMLEESLNRCNDSHDLLLQSTSISNLVASIERLVLSSHKLEINLGQLLDRNRALQLADELIQIITAEVQEEEAVKRIAVQITAAMNRIALNEDQGS